MNNQSLQTNREWWSQKWLDLLDAYRFKKRLERARNYARQGNVLSINFQGAKVLAKVQGSEPEPYQVSLFLDKFTDEQWGYVIETMAKKAIFSAKLLAGEMPQNIEDVFISNGLSLFPFTLNDVHSKCSCPDKAVPCKHIGAIYYQLSDRFSEDPFVLFQLRGRTKAQIIHNLRQFRYQQNTGKSPEKFLKTHLSENQTLNNYHEDRPKIDNSLDKFWQYSEPLEPSLVVISPSMNETILDVLGTIPLAEDPEHQNNNLVMKYLQTIYKDVSQKSFLSAMKVGE
ncbi:SWIM zinc finger family protein [Anabaena sp. FACHB-1237]|uniref:SWIM zinc finger family protein n=1 Tax=Anabaena sp. FACHB-1237 TaxID=2692769 RepID=UPI001681B64E|nr:SWIM zinc finger family protein [Anabaena sp. FACHB-1237]MBD2139617.1 SWIM zinc finger family protein [Anabaena sp. FACHB-1237]